ncbi:MAG: RuBisCO large subunit C-terminal-like domain-containing protein [Lachnospiraceae bacterium]|nr:RuBisCO large subunit C-terminal-like domain-containing protein [Lachnospiraceae bacterium]
MDTILYELPETIKNEPYIIGSYYIKLPVSTNVMDKARAMAVGQTLGTWVPVPGITEEMRKAHMGKVISVYEAPPVELSSQYDSAFISYFLQIAYPIANFDYAIPMMLTTLLGNDASTSSQVKLVDIQFPVEFISHFQGPKYGIEGLRKLVGEKDRPLFLNMIKPCTGITPEVGAKIFYETALGGPDFIKDDELLANPSFCPVRERVKAYNAASRAAYEKTGKETIYICNVTDSSEKILHTVDEAVEAGAKAIMLNFATVGLDTMEYISKNVPIPVMGHYAAAGMYCEGIVNGLSSHLLIGKLSRICGADLVMINTPYGGYPLTQTEYLKTVQMLTLPLYKVNPAMPICGGGVHPGMVSRFTKELGNDIVLAAGGAVQGHRDGAAAGAAAMRQAIDASMSGIDVQEYAASHRELATALKQFCK